MIALAVNTTKSSRLKSLRSFTSITRNLRKIPTDGNGVKDGKDPLKSPIFSDETNILNRLGIIESKQNDLKGNEEVEFKASLMKPEKGKKKLDEPLVKNIFKSENMKQRTAVLKSFIQVCEKSDVNVNKAMEVCASIVPKTVGIEVYEALIKSLARRGCFDSIQKVWIRLLEAGIQPSLRCYAGVFQSLGSLENVEEVQRTAQDLLEDFKKDHPDISLDLNDLLHMSPRTSADYDQLLEGLRLVDPNFQPKPPKTNEGYATYAQNDLVKDLSENNLSKLNPLIEDSSISQMMDLFQEQLQIEEKGFVEIKSITMKKDYIHRKASECTDLILAQWKKALKYELKRRIDISHKTSDHVQKFEKISSVPVYPFLELLPIDTLVECILHEIQTIYMTDDLYSPPLKAVLDKLSVSIMEKSEVTDFTSDEDLMRKYQKIGEQYLKWFLNPRDPKVNAWCPRAALENIEAENFEGPLLSKPGYKWPLTIRNAVGRELTQTIMDNVKLSLSKEGGVIIGNYEFFLKSQSSELDPPKYHAEPVEVHTTTPAFYKLLRHRKDRMNIELKPHPVLSRIFELNKVTRLFFNATDVPMLVPPLPWSSTSRGGFYLKQCIFTRLPEGDIHSTSPDYVIEKSDTAYPVFDALNQLGSTPWSLNEPILDLVILIFNNQDKYLDILNDLSIPLNRDRIAKPQADEELQAIQSKIVKDPSSLTAEERDLFSEHQANVRDYQKQRAESYSQWCDILYKLSIANSFRKKVMYFPHNIDFRGRVYPIAPHFHHMGGDLPRSLLKFANGRPLGELISDFYLVF